ncbi:L-lactate permease [Domibacillus robiginosus]|uniref:L-lactate permease n=1 Tax=Domibacillus robiginosus TaxID=1071054 RepID=UPI00067DA6C8|nr:L-lactate permease [Domibacillus robiginosus]
MLVSTFDPFHNLALSTFVAAIPILLFLLCLTVLKMKGIHAALVNLAVTFLIVLFVFKLPVGESLGSVIQGIIQGIWPIGYIIVMAVWLYKIAVKSGKFDVLRGSIVGISQDQRIQLLLIGFCFNAFLEGAAGFGIPIAICAVLLVSANTAGGVMAKLVSPQSIAIATAAVGETGNEAALTKMTIKYSFGLLAFVCIWTFGLLLIF